MIISFSGPSGAGKSTIIAGLLKLGVFNNKEVKVKQEDSFVTIRLLKYLLGENIFSKYKEEKYFKKKQNGIFYKFISKLSYFFYPVFVYTEFFADYVKYQILFKDKILIIDKFIYDHEVNFKNILGIKSIFISWLFDNFPKSDLAFLIEINLTNAAINRNKNNIPGKITAGQSFHKKILAHYNQIATRQNLLVIDNNGDLKDSINEIQNHILNKQKLSKIRWITICGMDGAGKTTVAEMLSKYADKLNIKCKIAHFVHNNLLYRLLVLVGFYQSAEPKGQLYKRSRAHSLNERLNKTSFLKAFLRFFDSYFQYLFYVTFYRNKLIIFDRYFYDYVVSFEYLKIRNRFIFNRFIPDVENKFLFESLPMTSYRRKPERVKEFFTENYQLYRKVARNWGLKIIKTDCNSPDNVLNELLKEMK